MGDNEWESSWPRGLARRGGLARRPQGDEGHFLSTAISKSNTKKPTTATSERNARAKDRIVKKFFEIGN